MNNDYMDVPIKPDVNKKIVLVGGCFDIIHYGHVSFLKKAKSYGTHLLVLLESDETIKKLKGQGRPFHTQKQRKEMLTSFSFVNEVMCLPPTNGDKDYFSLINTIKPAVIAVTEGDPMKHNKQKQADLVGASLVVIPKIHTPSTSQLVKLLNLE